MEYRSNVTSCAQTINALVIDLTMIATPGAEDLMAGTIVTGNFVAGAAENKAFTFAVGATWICFVYQDGAVDFIRVVALAPGLLLLNTKGPVGEPLSRHLLLETDAKALFLLRASADNDDHVGWKTHKRIFPCIIGLLCNSGMIMLRV